MGRKKLEIKARQTREGKQVTFSKRRMGVEKKAQELATLCDIPLLLILFSPGQRLSWISGSRGTPEEILKSYAEIPFEERSRRKIEVLEQLNRVFKKTDHEVNVDEFSQMINTTQSIKDLHTSFHDMHMNLLEKLREFENPKTLEHASQLEDILRIRFHQIEMHKRLHEPIHAVHSYDQIPIEGKSLQRCSEVAPMFGNVDAIGQEAWEARCMPNIFGNEFAPFSDSEGDSSIMPSCFSSSCFTSQNYLRNTINSCEYRPAYLDQTCRHTDDIFQHNLILDRNAQFNNALLPPDPFISTSLLAEQGFLSTDNLPLAIQYPAPYFAQPFLEYGDVKPLNNLQTLTGQ